MAYKIQITVDAGSPRTLGAFWCEVLGYIEQPPPASFETWEEALDSMGIDRSDPDRAFAIVDPDGVGPPRAGDVAQHNPHLMNFYRPHVGKSSRDAVRTHSDVAVVVGPVRLSEFALEDLA